MEIITVFGKLYKKAIITDKGIYWLLNDSCVYSYRPGWFQICKVKNKWKLIRCMFVDNVKVYNPESE